LRKAFGVAFVITMLLVLLLAALPAHAAGKVVDPPNGPPGWSHENSGQGGSPKAGPGGAVLLGGKGTEPPNGPPGWSHENSGNGGSPKAGPGGIGIAAPRR
jgi:hypothetical protein